MIYIIKTFLGTFILISILFNSNLAFADEATSSPKTLYETFWPLTAGKTIDDPLYFLKEWKENLRGMLVFGNPQKAEYAVFLGTKRVLEADKLIKEGKKDFADKTLGKASKQFDIAKNYINNAKKSNKPLGSSEVTIKPRLENLLNLIPTIQSNAADEVLQKIKDLQMNL